MRRTRAEFICAQQQFYKFQCFEWPLPIMMRVGAMQQIECALCITQKCTAQFLPSLVSKVIKGNAKSSQKNPC